MRTPLIFILFIVFGCNTPKRIAVVKTAGKFGCIDSKGNWIITPRWDWLMLGENPKDPILVEKDSLFGFISPDDDILISPRYNDASIFYEGLAAVGNGSKKGFINTRGDTVISFRFDDIFLGFSNGLSDARINDSCGYIDREGNVIIPFIYDVAYPFLSEYAEARTFDGRELVLDTKGRVITDETRYANRKLWTRNSADFRLVIEGPN
ncbi:MAG: Leptospira, partial [Flaviaesturariibacter sp.]|nr:Leptospira [Flaviaesturariibacter sp.]